MTTYKLGEEDVIGICPECKNNTTFKAGYEVGCEDCGSHEAVECEECGERFDSVRQYDWIREFNKWWQP